MFILWKTPNFIRSFLLDFRDSFDIKVIYKLDRMKISKSQRNNLIFLGVIALLIIPQTRKPIQVFLNKGLALFGPSIESEDNRTTIAFEDWKLQDLDRKVVNFKDLENKVIFLNFWATWCPPCIAEMGGIHDLYNDYKDDVVFLLVSNEKKEIVKKFIEKKGYTFNSYLSLSSYPQNFNISSIPRTFLISKNGDIVIDKSGAANWNSDKVRAQVEVLISE
jgi:thiol-disulfide isomerase/thioredoxin